EALDPVTGRRGAGPRLELVDDAANGDELDLVRIADDDIVEKDRAGRVIVGVDEAGHDGHLLSVDDLRSLAGERPQLLAAADRDEAAALDREGLRPRHQRVDGVDLGVDDHEIGVLIDRGVRPADWPLRADEPGQAGARQAHELPAAAAMSPHAWFPRDLDLGRCYP